MGIDNDETKEYFLADKYRLQQYLSNATVVAIDNAVPSTRSASDNVMWTYDCNIHVERYRKKHFR